MAQEKKDSGVSRRTFLGSVIGTAAVFAVGGYMAGSQAGRLAQPQQPVETTAGTVKLGSANPLTGSAAGDGQEMHRGTSIALEEINAQGGVLGKQVEWIELDLGEMTVDDTVNTFTRLADKEKVDFIVSAYTGTAYGPGYDVCAKYGVPFMHVDTVQDFLDWYNKDPSTHWVGFQGDPSDVYYGYGFPALSDQLINQGLWKPINHKAAYLRAPDAYGQRIAGICRTEMEKRGWTTTLDETIPFGTAEYGPTLSKIRADPPALVFNTDWIAGDMANFVIQFMEKPTKSLVYGQYSPSVPEFLELAGNKAEGLLWSSVIRFIEDDIYKAWIAKYSAKFGSTSAGVNAASTYDMTWMWANATNIVGTTEPKKVVQQLERMIFRGLCGAYKFTSDHGILPYPEAVPDPSLGMPHWYAQIQNKQHVIISPPPYTKGSYKVPPQLA